MVRFPNERRVEWKVSDFIKIPKERHRWWLPSFDTTICCLHLSKKIWFHWLRWIGLSNVCEFELKWFKNIATIQRSPIPRSTAVSYRSVWVWGNSLLQEALPQKESWGWRIHGGKLKFNWKTIGCYDKLVKLATVCQCRSNKCLTANVHKTISNVWDFVIVVENVTISDSDFIVYETFVVNVSNNFLSRYLLFIDLKI